MSTARALALIGPFYPNRDTRFGRIFDITEYTDPEHHPMIPHVIVLEPGLGIFKHFD